MTIPETGIVQDGNGIVDEIFTSNANSLNAFWGGFLDDESFIKTYNVCFSIEPTNSEPFVCQSTRSKRITLSLGTPLNQSMRNIWILL